MKKILLNTLIIIIFAILIVCILWFFKGSFEMFPIEEQMEKGKVGSGICVLILLIIEILLIRFRIKK